MDFTGSLLVTATGNIILLIRVEYLSGWLVITPTKRATAKVVLKYMAETIILQFGAPGVVVSDDATCFPTEPLQEFMLEK